MIRGDNRQLSSHEFRFKIGCVKNFENRLDILSNMRAFLPFQRESWRAMVIAVIPNAVSKTAISWLKEHQLELMTEKRWEGRA